MSDIKHEQFTTAVPLAPSTVFPQGCLLEESATHGVFQPFASGVPTLILKYAAATDASGMITFGGADTGMEQGQRYQTADAIYWGLVKTADLPQTGTGALTQAAITPGSGQCIGKIIEGTFAAGLLLLGARS